MTETPNPGEVWRSIRHPLRTVEIEEIRAGGRQVAYLCLTDKTGKKVTRKRREYQRLEYWSFSFKRVDDIPSGSGWYDGVDAALVAAMRKHGNGENPNWVPAVAAARVAQHIRDEAVAAERARTVAAMRTILERDELVEANPEAFSVHALRHMREQVAYVLSTLETPDA